MFTRFAQRPLINDIAYGVIAGLGLPRLLHRALFRRQITILMYHAVIRSPLAVPQASFLDEASFQRQVQYLKNNFEVVSLSKAVRQLQERNITRPTAVITFDDGFQNNYDVAFPILRDAGLPATIFLTTGLVNTADTTWFCRLDQALGQTAKADLGFAGQQLDLSGTAARAKASKAIKTRLKTLPSAQVVAETRNIILELGDDPDRAIDAASPFRMLSAEAVRQMIESKLIEFGAHTHSHTILSRIEPRQRRDEIERSRKIVEALTGRACELFAYPNGGPKDYDSETIRILRSCGMQAAVTGIAGPNDQKTPLMELRRYGIVAADTMAHFKLVSHHLLAHIGRLAQPEPKAATELAAEPVQWNK